MSIDQVGDSLGWPKDDANGANEAGANEVTMLWGNDDMGHWETMFHDVS